MQDCPVKESKILQNNRNCPAYIQAPGLACVHYRVWINTLKGTSRNVSGLTKGPYIANYSKDCGLPQVKKGR